MKNNQKEHPSGFTLIETVVASIILSSMMLGMIGILASYSKMANKSQDISFASNIAQQEIDVILADLKVQQSLASRDSAGRAARIYIYLNDGSYRGYLNKYFFNNFTEVNHDRPDLPVSNDWILNSAHNFTITAGNRFYDEFGAYWGSTTNLDHDTNPVPQARYVSRIQVFGIPAGLSDSSIPDIENTKVGTQYKYLMADTDTGISNLTVDNTYPLRKVLVVKIYNYVDYLNNNASIGSGENMERKVLCRMKMIINGGA